MKPERQRTQEYRVSLSVIHKTKLPRGDVSNINIFIYLIDWYFTPHSRIFQLYHKNQNYG